MAATRGFTVRAILGRFMPNNSELCRTIPSCSEFVEISKISQPLLGYGSGTAQVRLRYGGGTGEGAMSLLSCTEKTLQCAVIDEDMALHF